ncbi:MAG: hypothetical protein methR_P2594 [Methyloprofundus sp.]|nr:MAG: hypothetical protein methR_P2594 [Methyloprofundus sp.]
MKLINSPLSLRNSALTAALIFISTLIYSNISCAREGLSPQYAEMMKEMQRAMQLQQQAQGQFDKDLENANNDYDSKYTRMSDIELRSLMQKGDRGAIAEYILRMQQGSREKIGDSNADILGCIQEPESAAESVQQGRAVNLSDKEKSCMQKVVNEALMN